MKKKLNRDQIKNASTYILVTAAFLILQLLSAQGKLNSTTRGFLVPACAYIVLAVSLNLLVGICGELSLGHAGFMGISVNKTISTTFAIGSALAAIAGVLLCSTVPTLQPTTGSMPGIRAFTAAVFGGIGSIPGAMLGGILLGIIETFSKAYLSPQFSDAIVFAVLIVILLVKPAGLLGKQVQEKV